MPRKAEPQEVLLMRKSIPVNFGWEYHPNYCDEYLEKWYKVKNPELVDFPHSNVTMPFNGFDETTRWAAAILNF